MRVVVEGGFRPFLPERPTPSGLGSPGGERTVPVLVVRRSDGSLPTDGIRSPVDPSGNGAPTERTFQIGDTAYSIELSDEARARDQAVRNHERAHVSALGGYAASGVSFDTNRGPGGETVAVGGRIAVDMAEVPGDPRATLRKARTIYAAATAPGDPSAADMAVAAEAYRMMRSATEDLRETGRHAVDRLA